MVLTDDQRALQESARRFARERLLPDYQKPEVLGVLDRDLLAEMGRLGLIGVDLPERLGGLGVDAETTGLIVAAGDTYIINGEKTSITFADRADAYLIFARTGRADEGAKGVSAFFIPYEGRGLGLLQGTRSLRPADRPVPGRQFPARRRRLADRGGAPALLPRAGAARCRLAAHRRGGDVQLDGPAQCVRRHSPVPADFRLRSQGTTPAFGRTCRPLREEASRMDRPSQWLTPKGGFYTMRHAPK